VMTRRQRPGPELPAHAVLASAAAALPLPLVGDALGRLARGSALRRVLRRHGMRFGPGARSELAAFRVGSTRPGLALVLARVPGLRAAGRVRAGVATWVAARLLDRHLARVDAGAILDLAEAHRLRLALDACFAEGLGPEVIRLARELASLSGRTLGAPFRDDLEGRPPHLRVVDTLLDGLADLPADLFAGFEARFDDALSPLDAQDSREDPRT